MRPHAIHRAHGNRRRASLGNSSLGNPSSTAAAITAIKLGSRRLAFTLVEILVVIMIIGVLVSLAGMAAMGAMKRAKEARTSVEIANMDNAMKQLKSKFGAYPPCGTQPGPWFAVPGSAVADKANYLQSRVLRFVNRAFPKAGFQTYNDIRNAIAVATNRNLDVTIAYNTGVNVPVLTGASKNCCDLDTLDPAEALVFWLGGLPRALLSSNGDVAFELTRFGADPTRPMSYAAPPGTTLAFWVPGQQRTEVLYEFNPTRLVDRDSDGWPEYAPELPKTLGEIPPYVYFDAGSYNLRPMYPYFDSASDDSSSSATTGGPDDFGNTGGNELTMISQWGIAKPYARTVTPMPPPAAIANWRVTWIEPQGFQIVVAGVDGSYGSEPSGALDPSDPENLYSLRLFPDGNRIEYSGTPAIVKINGRDRDNLTNFGTGRLEDGLKEK